MRDEYKGTPSLTGEVTGISTVHTPDGPKLYVELPESCQNKLWQDGDTVEWEESMLCYDWGESNGLTLRNISRELVYENSILTDAQWVELTRKTIGFVHKDLRLGQAYMNALYEVDRDIYNEITSSSVDPFFDDLRIGAFFRFLNGVEHE